MKNNIAKIKYLIAISMLSTFAFAQEGDIKGTLSPSDLAGLSEGNEGAVTHPSTLSSPDSTPNVTTVESNADGLKGVLKPDNASGTSAVEVEGITGAEFNSLQFFKPTTKYLEENDDELYPYLRLKNTQSSRIQVLPDRKIKFLVKKGSLISNVKALMRETVGAELWHHKSFPYSLRLHNNFYLTGYDILDVLDQLIAPFNKRESVVSNYYPNNIVTLTIGDVR